MTQKEISTQAPTAPWHNDFYSFFNDAMSVMYALDDKRFLDRSARGVLTWLQERRESSIRPPSSLSRAMEQSLFVTYDAYGVLGIKVLELAYRISNLGQTPKTQEPLETLIGFDPSGHLQLEEFFAQADDVLEEQYAKGLRQARTDDDNPLSYNLSAGFLGLIDELQKTSEDLHVSWIVSLTASQHPGEGEADA